MSLKPEEKEKGNRLRPPNWTNDYRSFPGGNEQLSFYIYDNLRAGLEGSDVTVCYFDSLAEAIGAYRYLSTAHPEWTTALGGSIGGMREMDFIQRRMGTTVLVNDYVQLDFWSRNPNVQEAINELTKELHVQWQFDRSLMGSRLLIPWMADTSPLASELEDRTLVPQEPTHPTSAIREAYVEEHGWIPLAELVKASKSFGYDQPDCPKVSRLAVACASVLGDRSRFGVVDISPSDYKILKERYEAGRDKLSIDTLVEQAKKTIQEKKDHQQENPPSQRRENIDKSY